MEVLRQPMEDGQVTISRIAGTLTYPCAMMVVAAMNPCPCGYFGHPVRECSCSAGAVSRYLARVSGPLLDRLDLHVEVAPVEYQNLVSTRPGRIFCRHSQPGQPGPQNSAGAVSVYRHLCNAKLPAPGGQSLLPSG